jgi:hypothetical protein
LLLSCNDNNDNKPATRATNKKDTTIIKSEAQNP